MTGNLETLSGDECLARLAERKVGRVGITHDALPVIAPVNYALDGHSVVFRTRRAGMIASACKDAVIAFEIDELADDGSAGWSVLVVGVASPLGAGEEIRALGLGLVPAAGDECDYFIRLRIGVLSGRRVPLLPALSIAGTT